MVSPGVVIGILTWGFNFIAILIFLIIIVIGIKHRRDLHDISLVLTYNTSFAALLTCLAVSIMIISNLSNGFLTFNFNFCCICGLIYDVCQCSIYHSYYLQAFYRLCRVVFYKKKSLLSFSLFLTLIIGQWSLTIVALLPPIFLGWYVNLSTEQYCLVPYTNLGAELYHIMILYMIPIVCITIIYVWITSFIRESSRHSTTMLAINQQQRNLRDLTVIKRIVVLISILIALRGPTVVFMIYASIVGHLYPLTFGIVGLITSVCMIFMGIMLIHITPKLRNDHFVSFVYRGNRVDTQQTRQQHLTIPSTTADGTSPLQLNKSPNLRRNKTTK